MPIAFALAPTSAIAAGSAFEISASNSTPSINAKYNIKKKISNPTEFLLDSKTVISTPGNSGKYIYKSDYAAELGATLVDSGEILVEDLAKPFSSPILNAGADLVDNALGGLEDLTGWDLESIKMYGYYGFFLIIILIILYICNLTIFPAIGMLLKFNKSSTVNTNTASK